MRYLPAVLLIAFCAGCGLTPKAPRSAAQNDAMDREIAALSVAVLKKERGAKRPVTRDVHAKAHGCVRATFTVSPGVPADYRAGVLSEPGRTYHAWVRFSNGSSEIRSDKKSDARGMAIKLMGVEGEKLLESERNAQTQDFLLITHDAFFIKDGKDYLEFFKRLERGSNPAWFFFGRLPWRWTEFRAARQIVKRGGEVDNPLLAPYFSATPYQLGERNVVKYAVRPCEPARLRARRADSPDYLRLAMMKSLEIREGAPACFQFMVQRRSEPETMPVEDSRIPWDQEKSPFVPVATVSIPVQEFTGEAHARWCEDLAFTPWHALPAHRPLGNINRTRKVVYEAVSTFRREANGAPLSEPAPEDGP
ncbi:MAG: catalase family protein [Elusimicrobiota bacterium]|nr:catalase family protein [Elusimicrobiota bacterium]